jgi:hypothetical protein
MSKIMIAVFVGVFVSALIYEVVRRQDPELVDGILNNLRERIVN